MKDKRRKVFRGVVATKEGITKLVTDSRSISGVVAVRCCSFVGILRMFQVGICCGLGDWKLIPLIIEVTLMRQIHRLWTVSNMLPGNWMIQFTRG